MQEIIGISVNKQVLTENLLTFKLFHSFFGRMENFIKTWIL